MATLRIVSNFPAPMDLPAILDGTGAETTWDGVAKELRIVLRWPGAFIDLVPTGLILRSEDERRVLFLGGRVEFAEADDGETL